MTRLIIVLLLFLVNNVYSQLYFENIQFDLISQPKVREFIKSQHSNDTENFSDIQPSCIPGQDLSEFRHVVSSYIFTDSLEKVWNTYIYTSPAESWEGHKVKFGVLVSKNTEEVLYPGDEFSRIDSGQIVYLNLKIMKGVYNLPLAFEITRIDPVRHIVEFSYITGNVSKGIQQLHFYLNSRGQTVVVHRSYFKSHSKVRDMLLYPYFHEKATDEFHHNMKRIMKKGDSPIAKK